MSSRGGADAYLTPEAKARIQIDAQLEAAGWVVQLGAIALGFVVPLMFFLGALFALLWGTADFLGRKIERERAAAYAAYEQQ